MRARIIGLLAGVSLLAGCASAGLRGTGDLGVVIERANGSVQLVSTTERAAIGRVAGLGDLSHASVVYSRDGRYGYVFGRDGGLTKIDLLRRRVDRRVVQSGNAIGGAISQDGTLVAVANYVPGGVRVYRADTLELVADIPAAYGEGRLSKVVGIEDAPGNRFVFSLFDAGEIWIADFGAGTPPAVTRFKGIGKEPYDALVTPDGRYYLAGLFGEDGMAMLDLWHIDRGVQRVLDGYGKGTQKLPVFKMPHLEGWAVAGRYAYVPAVGRHEVLVIDTDTWREAGRIAVAGQPVLVIARPDGRQVWVNFAVPDYNTVQVIDTETRQVARTLTPGTGILHMEFTPRGEAVWLSARDDDRVVVYDTTTFARITEIFADKPSGIFFTARASRTGF